MSEISSQIKHYRKDIDGLRSLAVVPVVFSHAGFIGFSGGFVGVDIFFVISGYLITGLLLKELTDGRFSIVKFYERRARRILPALFFVLVVMLVVATAYYPPSLFIGLARSTIATLFFASNFWFFRSASDYFAPDAEFEPLLHTWSLAVEEQFYIVFPILLWWLMRWQRQTVLGILIAICLVSLAVSVWATQRYPSANFYFSITRAWELGIGSVLAFGIANRLRHRAIAETVAALGLAALVYSVTTYDAGTAFPGLAAVIPCLGAAAIIWSGTQQDTFVSRMLSNRVLVGIGLISYSLYLWHWPVFVLFRLQLGTVDLPVFSAVVATVISLALAIFSWKFVEQPFRKPAPAGFSQRFIFMSSAGAMIVVFIVSGAVELGKGFPGRMPADVLALFEAAGDERADLDNCIGQFQQGDLCEIGVLSRETAENNILLWGDSHAGAVSPGLDTIAAEFGLGGSVAFKAACAPLLDVVRVDMGQDHACDVFNSSIIKMLRDRDDYPVVVLAARWALVAEGTGAPGERRDPIILRRSGDFDSRGGIAENFAVFEEALLRTVDEIRKTGRQVIILASVPEIGWNVPQILGNAKLMSTGLPDGPSLRDVKRRNIRVDRVIHRAAEAPGVRAIDLAPGFCAPDCVVQAEGRPLYSDDDHLSTFGARRLIPEALRQVFGNMDWKQ